MSKLNINLESVKIAKAIKLAGSLKPIITDDSDDIKIITENWEKLNEEQLKNVFSLINWNEVFTSNKMYRPEDICTFLNVAIPYVEKYCEGNSRMGSIEYMAHWSLYTCICYRMIPHGGCQGNNYWGKILSFTPVLVRAFCTYQKLSENMIGALLDHNYHLDMCAIVKNQSLSEDFMEKYEELIDWELVSKFQYFSEDFLMKHLNKLNLDVVEERLRF